MNEQTETVEQTANPPVAMNDIPMSAWSPQDCTSAVISPQSGGGTVVVEGLPV